MVRPSNDFGGYEVKWVEVSEYLDAIVKTRLGREDGGMGVSIVRTDPGISWHPLEWAGQAGDPGTIMDCLTD